MGCKLLKTDQRLSTLAT